ncbi:MAG: phytoene desaturase family protein [Propionibacteriaceae bacterium]
MTPDADVIVVGGGLAGIVAAVRLAKQRHRVELHEATETLGGSWAPYVKDGVTVDDLPPVLSFPAPWRDLFRKSGRPLEAELARVGLSLEPAPSPRYVFADGTELELPADRGGQFRALTAAYGPPVATRWRDVLDGLAPLWQALRPLGLEAELRGRAQLDPTTRKALRWRESLADLARSLDHPQLGEILTLTAHRLGSDPERTPAWVATQLFVERTFGRWTLGRTSRLVDLLVDRLALRRVEVHRGSRVHRLLVESGRVVGVEGPGGPRRAPAVVVAVDPWQLYDRLLPHPPRAERRGVRRSTPARGAAVDVVVERGRSVTPDATETVRFGPDGPVTRWQRDHRDDTGPVAVVTTYDHRSSTPDPAVGTAWEGARSWLRRPPVSSALPGLHWAGPQGRGGGSAWATVLAGALATYGVHDRLTGDPR